MTTMVWEEFLAREDLVGGEIESQEDGYVYRGPLAEVRVEGNIVTFISVWMARLDPNTGQWARWDVTESIMNKDYVQPRNIGNGRIFFSMPFSCCTIFPKGGSTLDPTKVAGLNPA